MPYVLAAGIFALVVLGVGTVRVLLKSKPPASGDYVTQNVLIRINTEYRDAR